MAVSKPDGSQRATGLGAKARGGIAWAGLSVVLTLALQLGFGAVMARLLDPATFGLVAMALVTLKLFSYLSQIGLSMTLGAMQRQVMTADDLRVSLGVVWLASTVSIAAVLLFAPVAAGFFHKPELAPLVRVLSASLLLQALANVSVSLLRRQLRFKVLAAVEILGYALGYGAVGVSAAIAGWGAWSLVAATIAQALLTWVGAYALTRHPLLPRWHSAGIGHWQYGARHTLISFSEFLSANIDSVLIGRLVGDASLGLYNRAHVLAFQPVEKAAGIITRVLFPIVSVIQADRPRVGALFVLGIGVVGVVSSAVSLGLYAAADDLVRMLLGPKWDAAVPVVKLLALAVPAIFMSNIAGTLCDAVDILHFKLKLQLPAMAVIIGLMALLSGYGITGIVGGLVLGEVLRFGAYIYFLAPHLQYKRSVAMRAVLAALITGSVAFITITGMLALLSNAELPLVMRLAVAILCGTVALAFGGVVLIGILSKTEAGVLARRNLPGWQVIECFVFSSTAK